MFQKCNFLHGPWKIVLERYHCTRLEHQALLGLGSRYYWARASYHRLLTLSPCRTALHSKPCWQASPEMALQPFQGRPAANFYPLKYPTQHHLLYTLQFLKTIIYHLLTFVLVFLKFCKMSQGYSNLRSDRDWKTKDKKQGLPSL
jgi:hypothetical protein